MHVGVFIVEIFVVLEFVRVVRVGSLGVFGELC